MKIIDKRTIETTPFGEIPVGTVFIDCEGDIAIKIYNLTNVNNAVMLATGTPYQLCPEDGVTLVNAYLTIE